MMSFNRFAVVAVIVLAAVGVHMAISQDSHPASPVLQASATDASMTAKVPVKNGIMFSELTFNQPLGSEGSWIELYNSGDDVSLKGQSIIVDGSVLYTFTDEETFYSKRLWLLRFGKSPDGKRIAGQGIGVCTTLWTVPVNDKKAPKTRTPGYCALYSKNPEEKDSTILDYVQWGEGDNKTRKPRIDDQYRQAAIAAGLWGAKEEGIYIDVEGRGVGAGGPSGVGEVIVRCTYKNCFRGMNVWSLTRTNDATPGEIHNLFRIPYLEMSRMDAELPDTYEPVYVCIVSGQGTVFASTQPFPDSASAPSSTTQLIDLGAGLLHIGKDTIAYRLQIAGDPFFEEIVFDEKCCSNIKIPKGLLKNGMLYYGRARVEYGTLSTDWSRRSSVVAGG